MIKPDHRFPWIIQPSPEAHCTVIAEVALAHDGSLGMAHAFIDAVAHARVDAVKFQTHIAEAESTPNEPWRIPFSRQDRSRQDYWHRTAFSQSQWRELKDHCVEKGLLFLSTPFSEEAFYLLEDLGVRAWKVASGEITNRPLIEKMASTGKPILLSTGMSDLEEIDRSVDWIKPFGVPFAVLQCTSKYPCPPESVGINNIPFFRERYGTAGLSDHSGKIYPSLAAVTLGAKVIEVHVTLSRYMFGPDIPASLTIEELTQLVDGIHYIEKMLAHPVDKNQLSEELRPLRKIFMKSVVARQDLPAGTVLSKEHVAFKKPGTGFPPYCLGDLLGRRLKRPVPKDHIFTERDFE